MGKLLIIAEKPSVAKDIAIALGGFAKAERWLESPTAIVTSAIGHLVEIYAPEAETGGRDLASLPIIPDQFELRALDRTSDQMSLLRRLMGRSDVSAVVNACDAGREGELIFRLIYELAGCSKPMKRMWLQSMMPDAIRDAFRGMRPGSDFDDLAAAARSRSEADWLVGINSSRAITRLRELQVGGAAAMAAGRVQTPTLAIVVQRELDLLNFKPRDYWEVHGTFQVADGSYVGKWIDTAPKPEGSDDPADRIWDKARAEALLAKCKGQHPSEVRQEVKPSLVHPPKLFDLTSLQREANKRFGFSSQRTLDIAQALYETHKVATYPRTDSSYLPEDYIPKAIATLKDLAGTPFEAAATKALDQGWVKPSKRIFDNSKISDHFAIVPTGKKPEKLTAEEAKIYELVVKRFVAAFFPPAEYEATTRLTILAGEHFKSTGRVLVKRGWLEVDGAPPQDDDKSPALAKYVQGEKVTTEKLEVKSLKTKPPIRFTEDTLLGAMENAGKLVDDDELRDAMKERGLGTPATRAATIEGLLSAVDKAKRPKEPYLIRSGKHLVPTQKGMDLVKFLRDNGIEQLASPRMTGEWEFKLRQMEKGACARPDFMAEISRLTRDIIDVVRRHAAQVKLPTTEAPCPKCSSPLEVGPRQVSCKSACGFSIGRMVASRSMSIGEIEQLLANGVVGPFDNFLSKTKKPFSAALRLGDDFALTFSFDETIVTKTPDGQDVKCQTCESLMRRIRGKKGYFWACTDRESCKSTRNDNDGYPAAPLKTKPCPACSRPMYLRSNDRGAFWGCSGYKSGDCKQIVEAAPGEEPDPMPAGQAKKARPAAKKAPAKTAASKGKTPAAPSKSSSPFL